MKKFIIICFLNGLIPQVTAQTVKLNDTLSNSIGIALGKTYFGDEGFWGNSIFVNYERQLGKKISGQFSIGKTDGLELNYENPNVKFTQHSGLEIGVDALYRILQSNKLELSGGIGLLNRSWTLSSGTGKVYLSDPANDEYNFNGSGFLQKYNYFDGQITIRTRYKINKNIGFVASYAFQGNYISHFKVGIYSFF
jgi:hypothetical protein